MTGEERRRGRYERRKAGRGAKHDKKLSEHDSFDCPACADNLYAAFGSAKKGVSREESVRRYEANAMRNIAETRRRLPAGESVRSGFAEFTLNERGKTRHIKSVHISGRVVRKCPCDEIPTPILSRPLIHDYGAPIKDKGTSFALSRLTAHLRRFRQSYNTNAGCALIIDFRKFFDSIDHAVLFSLIDEKIKDERVKEIIRRFIPVSGNGKPPGPGSRVSQISAVFYPNKPGRFIKEKLRGNTMAGTYG